jgi:putative tryptophan/tyrosine transport system substrate-binding protein
MMGRTFAVIALFGLVAVAGEAEAGDKVWRIGALELVDDAMIRTVALPELAQHGFAEGRNLSLDVRVGTADEMPKLARELVATKPDAIIVVSDWALHPARATTKAIPVVTIMGTDPVAAGLAATWARPYANVTGLSLIAPELEIKRLELLREAVPRARRIGVLANHRQIVEGGMGPAASGFCIGRG